jgi:hypothetical protein
MSDTTGTLFISNANANISAAITINVAQIVELATRTAPTSAQVNGWESYLANGGSLDHMASAFAASTMFANLYNGGVLVDPNSSPTSSIVQGIIDNALGSHTTTQVNAWVNSGVSVATVFQDFALWLSSCTDRGWTGRGCANVRVMSSTALLIDTDLWCSIQTATAEIGTTAADMRPFRKKAAFCAAALAVN